MKQGKLNILKTQLCFLFSINLCVCMCASYVIVIVITEFKLFYITLLIKYDTRLEFSMNISVLYTQNVSKADIYQNQMLFHLVI